MSLPENHHRLDYVEFGTTDLSASRAFFQRVFGWEFTDYGPSYSAFKDGRLDGGFDADAARPASTAGPLLVLYSTDLEASLVAVREAGGTIVKEIFDFPGGRRFQFSEPGGNELAVWSE